MKIMMTRRIDKKNIITILVSLLKKCMESFPSLLLFGSTKKLCMKFDNLKKYEKERNYVIIETCN